MPATRCRPDSPRCATWAPRAPAYADVSVKRAIDEGMIPGPRLFISTRAIVATASYGPGPRGFRPDIDLPSGAQEVSGVDEVMPRRARTGRPRRRLDQGLRGLPHWHRRQRAADLHRRRTEGAGRGRAPSRPPGGRARRHRCRHAHGGRRRRGHHRARLRRQRGDVQADARARRRLPADTDRGRSPTRSTSTTTCPGSRRRHRKCAKPNTPSGPRVPAGDTIGCGSDVGVFRHGDNCREPAWHGAAGHVRPVRLCAPAPSVAAQILRQEDRFGRIAPGLRADLAAFDGDPTVRHRRPAASGLRDEGRRDLSQPGRRGPGYRPERYDAVAVAARRPVR